MRLSKFIHTNQKQIIENWVEFARTLLPWSEKMTEEGLRDHANEILAAIVSDMETPQTEHEQSEKSKGNSKEGGLSDVGHLHASERLESGQDINQLVAEYRALRSSVLQLWEEAQGGEQDELTRFNEAIDEVLAKSSAHYSKMAEVTREQFLGILGHDLRNPISAIKMGATLLTESKDAETAEIATIIKISSERMGRMVDDLLDLTRTRLGSGIPLTPKPMDLKTLCEQVIAELQGIHTECPIQFEAEGDLTGDWDRDRLYQVVSNLLSNALQYGRRRRPVRILVRGHENEVCLQVHNQGSPIPKKALKTIFAAMVRDQSGGTQSKNNAAGLGLGLFIVHEIVKAHGGTIEVTSTEANGTTFTLKIPRYPELQNA